MVAISLLLVEAVMVLFEEVVESVIISSGGDVVNGIGGGVISRSCGCVVRGIGGVY